MSSSSAVGRGVTSGNFGGSRSLRLPEVGVGDLDRDFGDFAPTRSVPAGEWVRGLRTGVNARSILRSPGVGGALGVRATFGVEITFLVFGEGVPLLGDLDRPLVGVLISVFGDTAFLACGFAPGDGRDRRCCGDTESAGVVRTTSSAVADS